ncbi:hypothetical protein HZA86_05480 [Candidatus Uhrbacteria bacterium]|nr:hypothetical protein [Candidatus Uhrbacteria bacterium]
MSTPISSKELLYQQILVEARAFGKRGERWITTHGGAAAAKAALEGEVAGLNNLHTRHLQTLIQGAVLARSLRENSEAKELAKRTVTALCKHAPSASKALRSVPQLGGEYIGDVSDGSTVGPR